MHRRQGFRLQGRQPLKRRIRERGIGHVVGQGTLLIFDQHRPITSACVEASTSPAWCKRSEHKSVRCVSSNKNPASQQWGTCGVWRNRKRYFPVFNTSPSCIPKAGRVATQSSTLTSLPTRLQTAVDCGAKACHSGNDPHSSASTWLNPIHLIVLGSSTVATASRTPANIPRGPVWNSNGSASRTRN